MKTPEIPSPTVETLRLKARVLAPKADILFLQAAFLTRLLETEELHESEILEITKTITDSADEFTGPFEEAVLEVSARGGLNPEAVRSCLATHLRDQTRREGKTILPFPGFATPCMRGVVLFSPGRPGPPRVDPEEVLNKAIRRLLEVLSRLPLDSKGASGIRKAIVALRHAVRPFDTLSAEIAFTAPPAGLTTRQIPAVVFEMIDTGSGPDPRSRRLVAVNVGPVVQETVDLTGFTKILFWDEALGIVRVAAEEIPSEAIRDGFITLRASGTDFAGNPPAVAERPFILDRTPPAIEVVRPAEGSQVQGLSVALEAFIRDPVSGIEMGSLTVSLNGNDVTAGLGREVVEYDSLGFPIRVRIAGTLGAQAGSNTLSLGAADRAGNEAQQIVTSTAMAAEPVPFVEIPVPEVTLEKVPPQEEPRVDWEGGYVTCPSGTIRVRAGQAGISLIARIVEGEGRIIPDRKYSLVTGADGIGGFRILFGRKEGDHVVEVTAGNAVVREPLRITVPAYRFPFQAMVYSDGVQGSGGLVDIFAPGMTRVKIYESDAAGNPVPPALSKVVFLDPEVTTDPRGSRLRYDLFGTAGFYQKAGAEGPYYITAEAVGVRREDGSPVRWTVPMGVGPRPDKEYTHVEIVSGQGQRAYPGRPTSEPLVARLAPGTEPDPFPTPDRIVFAIERTVFGSFFYEGEEYPGRFEVVKGTVEEEPIPGQYLVVRPGADGEAAVRYVPQLPQSALVGVGANWSGGPVETAAFVPQDLFVVGAPRIYLVRRVFARDAQGQVILDEEGRGIPGEGFEEIPAEGPDPYVHGADIFDENGDLKEPNDVCKFYAEMETGDYGNQLKGEIGGGSAQREPLSVSDGLGPTWMDLDLTRVEVEGEKAKYRSGPLAMTMASRTEEMPGPVSMLPGGVRLVQSDWDAVLLPQVPFTVGGRRGRLPGMGREARSPRWIFLGDSLTIGTQGRSAVRAYQQASYPFQACRIADVRCRLAAIEPAVPPRIWVDPKAGDPLVPDPYATPRTNPTLFVEPLGQLSEPFGERDPATYFLFPNILAIDGTEIRQAITQGRFSSGVSWLSLDPRAGESFTSDFTLEVLGGMEHESYCSRNESEWWLSQEILARSPRWGGRAARWSWPVRPRRTWCRSAWGTTTRSRRC